jgi:hypothetical protein
MTALGPFVGTLQDAAGNRLVAGPDGVSIVLATTPQPDPTPDPTPTPGPVVPAGANVVRVGSASYPLAAIDPSQDRITGDGRRYDGGRGPDELVAYTRPGPTGTNQHGAEVPVLDSVAGTVTVGRTGGLTVAAGGLVLSGHGRASAWIQQNVRPGGRVEFTHEDAPTPVPTPTPDPTPTPTTGRVRMLWHFPSQWGGPDPAVWPVDVLASVTHVSCGVAQSAGAGTGKLTRPDLAAAATLRAHGVKVYGQIGGSSDGGITIGNSQQVDEFVASVRSWGGAGADCDLEPSGGKWAQGPMVSALRECSRATGLGSIVTSGLYGPWTDAWGQVCKALGDDLGAWVTMLYDFPEAGDQRLQQVTRDKIGLMRKYVPDEKIVLAYMPRPSASYANASPPGVIPAAYAAGRTLAPAVGWALWEDKISTATGWRDLRELAKA